MARRKITLEEAARVFHEHGLKVKIESLRPEVEPVVQPETLYDYSTYPPTRTTPEKPPYRVGQHMVRVMLHAAHHLASGGKPVLNAAGRLERIDGQNYESYGPGWCTVPADKANDLLHQDMLARNADRRFSDGVFRSYIITPRRTSMGTVNAALNVSDDPHFDMSGYLGQVGNSGGAYGPFN